MRPQTDVTIETYVPGDEGRALDLVRLFKGEKGRLETIADFLSSSRNLLVGAQVDGKHVGLAIAYWLQRLDEEPEMLFLYDIEVIEEFRRRGVATRIMQFLKARAQGKLFVITQESNQAATKLYESVGGVRANSDDVVFALAPRVW